MSTMKIGLMLPLGDDDVAGYDDIKEGDVLEAYTRETFQRTL